MTPLTVIVDMGATHSFILLSCAKRLNLDMSHMLRGMIIDTPVNGSVTTSLVSVKYPVNFGNVDFALDLVCLPLVHMEWWRGKSPPWRRGWRARDLEERKQ